MNGKRVALNILGTPELQRDGSPVDVPLGKPFALLCYLVLEGRAIEREEMARLFWSDASGARARTSVRQALWSLRQALDGADWLTGDPLEIPCDAVVTDVDALENALVDGHAEEVRELWAEPFKGFVLADVPRWNEWVDRWRTELERRVAATFAAAAARLDEDDPAAIEWLEAAIETAPYLQNYHVRLVERLVLLRRFDAAEAALSVARRALGVEEDHPELDALKEQIEEVRRAAVKEERALGLEFVGRTQEYARLLKLWQRADDGARVAVVTGPAGMGKTRLVSELVPAIQATGSLLLVEASPLEEELPLGLLGELIRRLMRMRGAAGISPAADRVLSSLVPSSAREPSLAHEPPRTAIADALQDLIAAVAHEAPLAIVLEDFQWADRDSRSLISRVLLRVREAPVLTILTQRTSGAKEGAFAPASDITSGLGAMNIHLTPLSPAEVSEALTLTFEVERPERLDKLVAAMHSASGGNPLFLVELVRHLESSGVVRVEQDRFRLDLERLPDDVSFETTLERLTVDRLLGLSVGARNVAIGLARNRPAGEMDRLRQRLDLERDELEKCIEELIRNEIVHSTLDGRVVFIHDTMRQGALTLPTPRALQSPWRLRLIAATVVGLLIASISVAMIWHAAPAPFGGGRLLFLGVGGILYEMRPTTAAPEEWELVESELANPTSLQPIQHMVYGPYRLADGRVVWHLQRNDGTVHTVERATFVEGEWRRETIHLPEAFLGSPSPDGRLGFFTHYDANASPPMTRLFLERYNASDSLHEVRRWENTVVRPEAPWSRDGKLLPVRREDPEGALLLLNPRGVTEWTFTGYPGKVAWCGPGSDRLIYQDGSSYVAVDLDGASREANEIDRFAMALSGKIACSPNGGAAVYSAAIDHEPVFVLRDITTAETHVLPVDARAGFHFVGWLPDSLPPVPTAVDIPEDSVTLPWGGRRRLSAAATLSNGMRDTTAINWSSSHPDRVSVTQGGVAYGNRPGMAWIKAERDDWLIDSVAVTVPGEYAQEALVFEPFETLDTTRWGVWLESSRSVVQHAPGRLITGGEAPAGIYLNDPVQLPRGATFQVEFRFEPSAPFAETYVHLGLSSYPPPGSSDWGRIEKAVFVYPCGTAFAYEGPLFRSYTTHDGSGCHRADQFFPPQGWVQVAIQMRADGIVSFYVNGVEVDRRQVRLLNGPDTWWRIELYGGWTDEARVSFRNLVLWPEPKLGN